MAIDRLFERFVRASEPDDRKLYATSVAYSLFHLALTWHAYLTHEHAPPYAFVIVHMVFVGALYALPKEIRRWHGPVEATSPKAGHLLVLAWFLSFLLMGLGQYAAGPVGRRIPEGMTELLCFLLATLVLTGISKDRHRRKPPTDPPTPETAKPPA